MKLLIISVSCLLLQELLAQKVFFLGKPPKLNEGLLHLQGYYAESEQAPLILNDIKITEPINTVEEDREANSSDQPSEFDGMSSQGYADTESRGLFGKLGSKYEVDKNQARVLLPVPVSVNAQVTTGGAFSPLRITDTVSVVNVVPPLCVACTCLQSAPSCSAAGGVQLISLTLSLTTTLTGTISAGTSATSAIGAITGSNVIACTPTPTAAVSTGGTVTITCIATPPASLSVCDSSCRIGTTGLGIAGISASQACANAPSTTNCPQFPSPAVCSTPCQNLTVGAAVRCNAAYPTVISARPSNVCPVTLRKREAPESKELPVIESSIDPKALPRQGRFLSLSISRTTVTRTSIIAGTVTATYVATGNCLPSNILISPDC